MQRVGDQHQHRGVQGIVKVGDLLVAAVDRQRVLDQVVGTDREEIKAAQEKTDTQRRSGNLDHAADLDAGIEAELLATQAGFGLFDRRERCIDLVGVRQHRDQQFHLAVLRRPQDCPQLRPEHLRLGQRDADGPHAERRIRLDAIAQRAFRIEILVGAEVEGADDDRPAVHALDHLAVGLELLVLGRQFAAVEEEEFRAEQANAFSSAFQRRRDIRRQFDIRLQMYLDAIDRRRLRTLQPLQLGSLELELRFAQLVFLEHARIGIDDDDTARAVDDQRLLVTDQLTRIVQAEHCRNGHAAAEDRGVRRGTADIGDERREVVFLEGDHVRRRQVMRDDDQVLFLDALRGAQRRPADMAGQLLDDALDHLPDVLPALAQIGVLEFVELRDQLLHLLHQRPFGIAAALADQRLRYLAQLGIVEDHAVQVEEGTELGRCMLGTFLHGRQLALHLLERGLEAGHLLVHHPWCDGQVGDFQRRMRNQVGGPDGNAAGNAEAVQGKAHRLTPLRRTCRRSMPAGRSSPPVRRRHRSRRRPASPCRRPASSRP